MSYTEESKIEAQLGGLTIDNTTTPTTAQVAIWITEVEAEITEKALGSHTATDTYLDVPATERGTGVYDVEYDIATDTLTTQAGRNVRIVPITDIHGPILSITSLYKNDAAYDAAPSWEELDEWDGSSADTSFLLRQSGNKQHGYVLIFYDNFPLSGPKRIKMTYSYGHNVSTNILSEYATKRVAINVLQARMGSNQVDGLHLVDMGGDVPFVYNTNYKDRIAEFRADIARIEERYFPDEADGNPAYVVI